MLNIRDELVKSIMAQLNMTQDAFVIGSIMKKVEQIPDEKLYEFYDALFGDEHSYLKPMDRVAKVAKSFENEKRDELFDEVPALAKAMYDKFLAQNIQGLMFCMKNRNKIPSDREFFKNTDYKELKNSLGEKVYTDKELYVLKKLGGGEFLLGVTGYQTSKAVTDKIEAIIREVITKKYLTKDMVNAIESSRVRALIAEVA